MEIQNFTEALSAILEVEQPWILTKIDIRPKNKVVDVFIDYSKGSKFLCPQCEELCPVHDSEVRRIRHLDLFEYQCYLNIRMPRIKCKKDGVKTIRSTKLFRHGSHYTFLFENKVMRLCKEMSMSAISKEMKEPDSNLWRIFKHYTSQGVSEHIDLKTTTRIAVDETATKRGHSYVTIFTDMDSRDVILVEEGRKKDVFKKLYGWLFDKGGHPKNIELFSMDMSVSYKAGRKDYFAHSQEVYDRFHIKKLLNEAVNSVRQKEVREMDSLKKTKYIWLKSERKLKEKEKIQLADFIAQDSCMTAIAYKLKQSFDQLWQVQKHAIVPFLKEWIQTVKETTLEPMKTFVNTLENNHEGIMMSFQTGLTNAISEGINSVIQLARTRARGFRNLDNFKAMIYFLGNSEINSIHSF
jgi:transposase